ncbi:MAG: type II secretion system F family protein [Planctomycetales bacterium]|nr:type II secretion system F family protein [Planctomycetales bacterium]
MFIAITTTSILIYCGVFGAFAAGAWWVLDMMASKNTRAEERLSEFKDPSKRTSKDLAKKDNFTKVLAKASPALAKPLQPKNEKETSKLKERLVHAGFRSEAAPGMFLSLKVVGFVVGFIMAGGSMALAQTFDYRYLGMAFLGLFLPDIVVWFIGKQRKESIFLGLPDTLDLMVVCVEAGLGLDQAMRKVAEEMKKSHRVLAEEFAICNFQLQMGKTRREVLQELGSRTGVDDLRSLASVLIQAEKFGSSVGRALRVQSDSMRTRRRQLAEERAAKTAVQLIFPLVIFIFPGIFVVLVGPAAITMMREMFPAMNK